MQSLGYGTWENVINEHVISAITSRFAYRTRASAAAEAELRYHEGRGFAYVRPLYERLQQYEAQRERYPTFTDFYPRVVDVFADLAAGASKARTPPA